MARAAVPILGLAILLLPLPAMAQPVGVPPIPARKVGSRPPPRSERFAWQPGHWEWDLMNARYVWRSGRHVVRRPGVTRFLSGRWVQTGGEWVWRHARWR